MHIVIDANVTTEATIHTRSLREPYQQISPHERNHDDDDRNYCQARRSARLLPDAIQTLLGYLRAIQITCTKRLSAPLSQTNIAEGYSRDKTSVDCSRIPFSSSSDLEK